MLVQVARQKLDRPIDVHVDGTIGAGDEEFIEKFRLTEIGFGSKQRIYDNITFAGLHIETEGKTLSLIKVILGTTKTFIV